MGRTKLSGLWVKLITVLLPSSCMEVKIEKLKKEIFLVSVIFTNQPENFGQKLIVLSVKHNRFRGSLKLLVF